MHRFDNGLFYPGGDYCSSDNIGKGAGKGYNVFFGFSAADQNKNGKVNDYDYIYACQMLLFPIVKAFKPDLIIVSCGFDSAKGDPLGGIGISPLGYAWMTHGLLTIRSRILVALEGGYNLEALAVSSEAVVRTLMRGASKQKEFNELLGVYEKKYGEWEEGYSKDGVYERCIELSKTKVRQSFVKLVKKMAKDLVEFWPVLKPLTIE